MKLSYLLSLGAVALVLTACVDEPTSPVLAPRMSVFQDAEDTYLVRFQKNSIPAGFAQNVAALGGEVVFAHAGVGIAAVSGLSASGAAELAMKSGIAAVDADAYVEIEQPELEGIEMGDGEIDSPANPALAVFYGRQQWNMGVVRANAAWAAGKLGSPSVKVGILDTGLDYLHPDLAGRVDLSLSRSFLSAAENARVPAGAHPVADLHYHGTHVGATVVSNGWIGAGVSSQVTLVGLKVCAPGTAPTFAGTCPTSGTLAAILYAADNGIPIINMSLGGSFLRRNASATGGVGPSFLATINNVMNYANRKGTVVVVSAGNSAIDMDNDVNGYKSYCDAPHVLCVSATAPTFARLAATAAHPVRGEYVNIQNIDAITTYSNYGGKVTLAAPGGRGTVPPGGSSTPVWAACSGFTIRTGLASCRTRFYNSPTSWSGSIVGLSGTSMASPHVAGVAALVASHVTSGAPQIRARVIETADDLGAAGLDPIYGNGRVNVARALGLQ